MSAVESLDDLKNRVPGFAKDVKLNISSMLSDETLPAQQRYGLFLASAIATRNGQVVRAFETLARAHLSAQALDAARAAAAIMAMNNIYYRFVHLAANKAYETKPARLRMNVIGNPGVDKADFELWSLAVSAINGCGKCIDAHEKVLKDAGVTEDTVQTAVRFAAIIQSFAVALEAGEAAADTDGLAVAAE
ncbi:MAG TPA: carboxymuconolactone decarboxylase family protein [Xanthobacteraceae bacterium]|nr:carboxymuconolactone decarboxylase family protein [Xanthobacteraceae bacterium]